MTSEIKRKETINNIILRLQQLEDDIQKILCEKDCYDCPFFDNYCLRTIIREVGIDVIGIKNKIKGVIDND